MKQIYTRVYTRDGRLAVSQIVGRVLLYDPIELRSELFGEEGSRTLLVVNRRSALAVLIADADDMGQVVLGEDLEAIAEERQEPAYQDDVDELVAVVEDLALHGPAVG